MIGQYGDEPLWSTWGVRQCVECGGCVKYGQSIDLSCFMAGIKKSSTQVRAKRLVWLVEVYTRERDDLG